MWKLPDGTILDLRVTAPSTVLKLLATAVETGIWRDWAHSPSASGEAFARNPSGYWMPEVRKWCNPVGRDWRALEASCVNSIVCGSQWGQERLFFAGFLDFKDCQACSGLHRGTVQHRTWSCKTVKPWRDEGIKAELVA